MKKLIKIGLVFSAMTLLIFNISLDITKDINGDTSLVLTNIANTANAEEPGYSCTVKTVCAVNGFIQCTGVKLCSRGSQYVECDGNRTEC